MDDNQGYFVATVNHPGTIDYWLYTEGKTVPSDLEGILYSSDTPGGKPRNDGTGKIYIVLKPEKNLFVYKVNIDGDFSSIENTEGDIYCISGVKSDLKITVTTKTMLTVNREVFLNYGYGISDNGKLTVVLKGEIDHHCAKDHIQTIEGKIEAYSPYICILDFRDVTFMDSSRIAVVINAIRAMARIEGKMVMCGVAEQPMKVFRASGIDKLIQIKEAVG